MICSRCKVDKDPENDFIHGKTKCRECYKKCCEYYKANRAREIERAKKNLNKDRVKTNNTKRYYCKTHPVAAIFWSIKNRAKSKEIPFNIGHEDIIIPEHCPVLGLKLEKNEGKPGFNSPSLDRINPDYGYIKGNVQVISHRANMLKSSGTVEELRKVLAFMEKQTMPILSEEGKITKKYG